MENHKKQFTAVIVDDEQLSVRLISQIIQDVAPEIRTKATFTNPLEAAKHLEGDMPDMLFIDMDMPELQGLELLKQLGGPGNTYVVSVTGHENFAVEALRSGVHDYLVKPITAAMVRETIDRFLGKKELESQTEAINLTDKILINRHDKTIVLNVNDILYIAADGPYTHFYTSNNDEIKSSKSLGYYKQLLEPYPKFASVHRSYLINFDKIKEIIKDDKESAVVMENGVTVSFDKASKSRLPNLINDVLMKLVPM